MNSQSSWDDQKLEVFYQSFVTHVAEEQILRKHQQELYEAVFRKEDKDNNTSSGLLQLTVQISRQLNDMQLWQDRQKTFVGGVFFTVTAVWFFLTEAGHKLFALLQKL